jgi:hypothetical protein
MIMDDRVEKLERFFKEVADLAFNHKVLADTAVELATPLEIGDPRSPVSV